MTDTSTPGADVVNDRRDLLSEAFDALEGDQTAQPEASPARDEHGRFVAQTPPADGEAPPDPEPEPAWVKPPSSWKKDYHEPWGTLDPKVREYVWQREEEMKAGVEPLKTKAQIADAFNKAVEPYLTTIQGLGLNPIDAAAQLMATDYKLRTLPVEQKRGLIAQLATAYGVSLSEVTQETPPAVPPEVFELRNELNTLRGTITGMTQAQQEAADQAMTAEIEAFAKTAELFDDARPVMVQLLQSGLADGVKDAYEKALRLDPVLSEKAAQSLQAAAEAKQRAEADQKAKAAKANAVSVRGSSPGAPPPVTAKDRRAMLAEQLSSIEARL